MGRPRQDDGEPAGAGPDPGYLPPDVGAPPGTYPPASRHDAAAAYPPGQQEAAPYPPGQKEAAPAPYPPPSPYPPPVQFPPSKVETLPPQTPPVVQDIGIPWSTGLFDCHEDQTNGKIKHAVFSPSGTVDFCGVFPFLLLITCLLENKNNNKRRRRRRNYVPALYADLWYCL